MKIHFAGSDGNARYNLLLNKGGAKCRLESFYTLKNKRPSLEFDLLLDSGGFVARTKGIEISVREYASFINQFGVKKAFNLDTNDLQETLENQKYLEKNTLAKIIPIYHLSDYQDNRELLLDFKNQGYDYVGIGGVAGEGSPRAMQERFYNYIFHTVRNDIKLHGLGITSFGILNKYPFYSVDSTSWLSAARYGNSIDKSDKRVTLVRARTGHYLNNTQHEVHSWVEIEKRLTKTWEARGIVWE